MVLFGGGSYHITGTQTHRVPFSARPHFTLLKKTSFRQEQRGKTQGKSYIRMRSQRAIKIQQEIISRKVRNVHNFVDEYALLFPVISGNSTISP